MKNDFHPPFLHNLFASLFLIHEAFFLFFVAPRSPFHTMPSRTVYAIVKKEKTNEFYHFKFKFSAHSSANCLNGFQL